MKQVCKRIMPFILVILAGSAFAWEQQVVNKEVKGVEVNQQQTVVQGIPESIKISLNKFTAYLPKLAALLLIIVVGCLLALGITALVGLLLKVIRLEKVAKKINIPEILKNGGIKLSLSELLTEIVFFLIILVTLITALEYYGLSTGSFVAQILAYVPKVVAAVFILILGILSAIFISGIITLVGGNVKIAQSALLGNIAKYPIIIFSGLLALKELGMGIILTDKSKDIIFAGLVLSFVLAFGLGMKQQAEKLLNKIFK